MSYLYVHLIPQTSALITETIKVAGLTEEALINDVKDRIYEHLDKSNVSFLSFIL